jgi:hypothetical protein
LDELFDKFKFDFWDSADFELGDTITFFKRESRAFIHEHQSDFSMVSGVNGSEQGQYPMLESESASAANLRFPTCRDIHE